MTVRKTSLGQVLVEFALIAPMFFVLVFAVIDVGRAIVTYNLLANSARDGARYAVVSEINSDRTCNSSGYNDPNIVTAAKQSLGAFAGSITVSVARTDACAQDASSYPMYPIHFYKVTSTTSFQPYTALVIGHGPIVMTATSKMYMYTKY